MTAEKKQHQQPIPGFKIISKLGAGGMGAVYKAIQSSLEREVALKIMPMNLAQNPEFKERFFREARAAGKLNHINIVQGIDAGEAGKFCWIAMELVKGGSVARLLQKNKQLPTKQALSIVTQIAQGLEHASKAGIVHRDVKPENFLFSPEGIAKLCDLGIAKVETDSSLTQEGRALGTPFYISPEQARGEQNIDLRADIYSLGASWYHMLAGKPLFTGQTAAIVMTRHITEKPPSILEYLATGETNTARVMSKMLAKKPKHRYQNFNQLLADLEALAKGKLPKYAFAEQQSKNSVRQKPRKITARTTAVKSVQIRKTNKLWLPATVIIVLLSGIWLFLSPEKKSKKVKKYKTKKIVLNKKKVKKTKSKRIKPKKRNQRVSGRGLQIEKAYKQLLKDLPNTPEIAQPELLYNFADEYPKSKWGKIARIKAKKMEIDTTESDKNLVEDLAREAFKKLPDKIDPNAREKYKIFQQDFAGTKAAGKAGLIIDEINKLNSLKNKLLVLPEDNLQKAQANLVKIAQGKGKAAIAEVEFFLTHRKSSLRNIALKALFRLNQKRCLIASIKALQDRNAKVRFNALEILEQLQDDNSLQTLKETARNDLSPQVREKARKIIADY